MIEATAGTAFTAIVEGGNPGLVGTIGVAVEDPDNNVIRARTTDGIVELAPGTYAKDDLVAPTVAGTYVVIWDDGTSFASEELRVVAVPAALVPGGQVGDLSRFINRPCVLVRRSASGIIDEYGDAISDEVLVETVCEVQQAGASEAAEGSVSETGWNGFFLAGTDVDAGDAVMVGDEEYEVAGSPWFVYDSLRGGTHHVEAKLRKASGVAS